MIINLSSLLCALSTTDIIVLSVVGGLFIIMFVAGAIRMVKNKKVQAEVESREVESVTEKHGVRYTDDMTIVTPDGDPNLSYGKGDRILKQNQTYMADKHGYIHPGKYTILSTKEDETAFNVRIGAYVREYHHGQQIILADGEEITAVSTDVILR